MNSRYKCPRCGKRENLWEGVEVPGWRSVDDQLHPVRPGYHDRDVVWGNERSDGSFGCAECGWEGLRRDLRRVVLGVDGKPLPEVHPRQEVIP